MSRAAVEEEYAAEDQSPFFVIGGLDSAFSG